MTAEPNTKQRVKTTHNEDLGPFVCERLSSKKTPNILSRRANERTLSPHLDARTNKRRLDAQTSVAVTSRRSNERTNERLSRAAGEEELLLVLLRNKYEAGSSDGRLLP